MTITDKILTGIKQAITEGGKVNIDLREASSITASGSGVGGRVMFDDAFAALRYANPFRMGARQIPVSGSDAMFVAKTGDATGANAWSYTVTSNAGNSNTSIWQMPVRVLSASMPIRTAVLSDVNNLPVELVEDMALEFGALEAASMAVNDDQAGSATTSTGATVGLRGLDSYVSGAASAFGTSGTAITNGIHTIGTVSLGGVAVTYNKIVEAAKLLGSQYWSLPGTAWHMTPDMIYSLRAMKDSQGMPLFLEIGDADAAAVGRVFGWPVIPNPYLSAAFPIYLGNWPRFLTIGDAETMSVQMFEQSAPGFVTIYAERRMVSTVRDPFAGARVSAA